MKLRLLAKLFKQHNCLFWLLTSKTAERATKRMTIYSRSIRRNSYVPKLRHRLKSAYRKLGK